MAVTVRGTDILFNDGTTQSSAGMAVPSSITSIGGHIVAIRTTTNNMTLGGTISGSYLFYASNVGGNADSFFSYTSVPFNIQNRTTAYSHNNVTYVPIGVGTWMMVAGAAYHPGCISDGYGNYLQYTALWRRIS